MDFGDFGTAIKIGGEDTPKYKEVYTLYKGNIGIIGDTPKRKYNPIPQRTYYLKNRERINKNGKAYEDRCLKSWEGYIPIETLCAICGKTIYFNKKVLNTAIHFDHRLDGQEPIQEVSPNQWLRKHKRTPENEKTWESCNFGILCRPCNSHLPTKDRKEYLMKVIKYVFGEEAKIVI